MIVSVNYLLESGLSVLGQRRVVEAAAGAEALEGFLHGRRSEAAKSLIAGRALLHGRRGAVQRVHVQVTVQQQLPTTVCRQVALQQIKSNFLIPRVT